MIRGARGAVAALVLALAASVGACGHVPSASRSTQAPDAPPAAASEVPPATDIFLVRLDPSSTPWRLADVERLTDRDAYDNQPLFEPDGAALLYVSMRDDQTDVYRYSRSSGEIERVTDTAESEYSPTPIPGSPDFSAVRVEADDRQRLWRYPGSPEADRDAAPIFEAVEPVGYHAWIDPQTVALFVLGEPHRLEIGDTASQRTRTVASAIGRSLHAVPGRRAVSFVDKTDPERWWVSVLELETGAARRLVATPNGSEDFVWWSSRELLIGSGSKLFVFDLEAGSGWREVADLSAHGIAGITRLAPAPRDDLLAVVGERRAQ